MLGRSAIKTGDFMYRLPLLNKSIQKFIIITIIIIIISSSSIIISFMQGIYTYIPETNYVPREYSVAAILLLLFLVHISLVSVLNCVQCPVRLFSVVP